jgi:hypothetical protein
VRIAMERGERRAMGRSDRRGERTSDHSVT